MNEAAAIQASVAILLALVIWLIGTTTERTVSIGALLLLIPFQFVETRVATSNVIMTCLLFGVVAIRGGVETRLLWFVGFIIASYSLSIAFAPRDLQMLHIIYTLNYITGFLVFLLAYTYGKNVTSENSIIDLLLSINILVVLYSTLQLFAGPGNSFTPFGIEAFAFNTNRFAGDPRLVGPFDSPGVTSTYFLLMNLVCFICVVVCTGRRRGISAVLGIANLIGIIATANRGAFLTMLAAFPMMLWMFRRELGAKRAFVVFAVSAASLTIASMVAIQYTEFNQLYTRLADVTETVDGLPKNRAETWKENLESIERSPWFGEGPRFIDPEVAEQLGQLRTRQDRYPHNLYIFTVRTVGVLGLIALLAFLFRAWGIVLSGYQRGGWVNDKTGLLRFGILLLPVFLVDQLRLEFNRFNWLDFSQFVLMLVGLTLAVSDRRALSVNGQFK